MIVAAIPLNANDPTFGPFINVKECSYTNVYAASELRIHYRNGDFNFYVLPNNNYALTIREKNE